MNGVTRDNVSAGIGSALGPRPGTSSEDLLGLSVSLLLFRVFRSSSQCNQEGKTNKTTNF